jgi:hypothetical protein
MPIVKPQTFADLFAMVRAGNAWRFDAAGALAQVGAGVPRVDYDPGALTARGVLVEGTATNLSGNPRFEGAVAGIPGTQPSGNTWLNSGAGLTREIVGVGVEDGWPYIDVRWSGTPSSSTTRTHSFVTNTAVAALPGESWTSRVATRLVGGSLTNVSVSHSVNGLDGAGTQLDVTTIVITGAVGAAALRNAVHDATVVLANAATAFVRHRIILGFTIGLAVDITVRMAAPQLWLSAVAFSPSLPPVSTPGPSTRAADDLDAADLTRYLNPAAGTFVVQFTPGQATAATHRGILTVDDGTGANEFRLRMLPGATTVRLSVDVAGAEVLGIEQASGAALVRHTARVSYGPAGWLLSVNGAAPIGAAGPIPAGLVRALLGRGLPAGEYLNGWLGPRFEYYPVQYTDTAAADGFTIRTR